MKGEDGMIRSIGSTRCAWKTTLRFCSALLYSTLLAVSSHALGDTTAETDGQGGETQPQATAVQETTTPEPTPEQKVKKLISQYDKLYDTKRSDAKVARHMLEILKEAERIAPAPSYDLAWRMAQIHWWLAEGSSDSNRAIQLAKTGWDYGKKAIRLNPKGVEGHMWLATSIGQYSLGVGVVKALMNGLEGKFLEPLDKAIQIDPAYACASPLRTKGSYYKNLPWPKQDLDQAEAFLKKSLKLAPCGLRSHYYLAEVYEKKGDKAAAIAELDKIINFSGGKADRGDLPRIRGWAKKMKARLQ